MCQTTLAARTIVQTTVTVIRCPELIAPSRPSESSSVMLFRPELIPAVTPPSEPAAPTSFELVSTHDLAVSHDPIIPVAFRFKLRRQISRDSLSEVWLARDLKCRRSVVVKLLHPELVNSKAGRRHAVRERKSLARLSHPNVVTFLDGGVCRFHGPYTVMEYVKVESLIERFRSLQAHGELMSVREVLEVTLAVAAALQHAHARGVLHLNIKCGSILMPGRGLPKAKLCGFEFAKRIGSCSGGSFAGAPAYASPEQLCCEPDLDPRSDLYALGVVMYTLLAGRHPFPRSVPEADPANRAAPPVALFRSDVLPNDLCDLVQQLMDNDRNQRPRSASAVAARLRRILAALPTPPLVGATVTVAKPQRKPWVAKPLLRVAA